MLLCAYVFSVIIIFIILIALLIYPKILSTQIEKLIDVRYDDDEEEFHLIQTAQWMSGYISPRSYMLKHYMRNKTQIDNSFLLYCQSFYDIVKTQPFKMQTILPEMVAFALHYNDLKRDDTLESLLANIIEKYPNPFYRNSDEEQPKEILSILYGKLAYHVIYYEYLKKHNLTKKLFYNEAMMNKIYAFLNESPTYLRIADLKDTSKSGYVFDENHNENGIIKNGVPCGISEGCLLVEKLYFLMAYKRTKALELLLQNVFERLAISIYRGYLQIRGGDEMNLLDYRFEILKALALCYERNNKLHINGEDFKMLVAMLSHKQKAFFLRLPTTLPNTINYDNVHYYSSSEGLIVLRNKLSFIELAFGLYPRAKNTTNMNLLDSVDFDDDILTDAAINADAHNGIRGCGSITYATPLPFPSSIWKTAWLAGLSKTVDSTFKPIVFTVVPLNEAYTLFYIAYHTDDYIVDSYFNLNTNHHSLNVRFLNNVRKFIILSLFDLNNVNLTSRGFINDNIFINTTQQIAMKYENDMIYYYLEHMKKGDIRHINITFDMINYIENPISSEPIIKPIVKFSEQFSAVTPSSYKADEFVEVIYYDKVFIIYRNKVIPYLQEPLVSVTYNKKVYTMMYKFLTYYAIVN